MLKPQGRKGEVAVELSTSFPERFAERRHVSALLPNGRRRSFTIEDFWPHLDRLVLKFAGVDSISDAEALRDAEIQIERAERAELAAGEAFVSDLIGCEVVADGKTVGMVEAVDFSAGEAPLLVTKHGKKEILIPFAAAYLVRVDVEGKRIEMRLPEGLLEL